MFGSKKNKKNPLDYITLPKIEIDPPVKRGILIVIILVLSIFCFLSLFDLAGILGIFTAKGLISLLGWGRWFFPLSLIVLAYFLYNEEDSPVKASSYFGLFLLILALQTLFHLFLEPGAWSDAVEKGTGGGWIGYLLAIGTNKIMGVVASMVVFFALLLISLMLTFNLPLKSLVGGNSIFAWFFKPVIFGFKKILHSKEDDDEESENDVELSEKGFTSKEIKALKKAEEGNLLPIQEFKIKKVVNEKNDLNKIDKVEPAQDGIERKLMPILIDLPINLLEMKSGKPTSGDIKNNILIIKKTFENFGIGIEMGEVKVGPTVTQYAFKPAEGVKVSRITTLRNNLSLALAAHPLRIEAPIPGKSLAGIEVPNQKKAIVCLRELLEDPEFKNQKAGLILPLGRDVSGQAWFDNLAKMPHLIVAGATNSGKSVCLNTLIVGLLYQYNPQDLRFILVDPKRVELTVYNGIPHLLTPVITEVSKTINALKWCLNEMDRRFETLASCGKRNIQAYNENLKKGEERMPYIIFIIDELADLMVVAKKDVEASIIRLAQMARAVGIHLILATQRPSTDVITGLIKANMPARIAFAVASNVDSRTILDASGAEDLLGQGDMLLSTPSLSQPKRVQGAYLSDEEIKKIVTHIRAQVDGEPEYIAGITDNQKVKGIGAAGLNGNNDSKGEDADELLQQAKDIIINGGKASASMLQRRLSVGYARAARLLDLLEEAGVIGPANGAKPRDILITKEEYENQLSTPTVFTQVHYMNESKPRSEYLDENNNDQTLYNEAPDTPTVFKNEYEEDNDEDLREEFKQEIIDEVKNEDEEEFDVSEVKDDEEKDDDNNKSKKTLISLEDEGRFFSK